MVANTCSGKDGNSVWLERLVIEHVLLKSTGGERSAENE